MTTYPTAFKKAMLRRMLGPEAASPRALARESGVAHQTLSRWRREARSVVRMDTPTDPPADAAAERPGRRPEDWPPEEKLQAVIEAAHLGDDELGAFLRRKGLHAADLAAWTRAAMEGIGGLGGSGSGDRAGQRRLRSLERELRRKEKALAEAAALLVLQGKVRALLGEEGDATTRS